MEGYYLQDGLWWKIGVPILVWIFFTLILYLVAKNEKYDWLGQQWVLTMGWFCFTLMLVFLDGKLLTLGLVNTSFYCSAGISIIFVLSRTLQKLGEFRIQRGNTVIEGKMQGGNQNVT